MPVHIVISKNSVGGPNMDSSKRLKVFDASAGSGKTYTLSSKYSEYLLNEYSKDPNAFRHILAVTFTNKSTFEMKKRIIDRLWEHYSKAKTLEEKNKAKAILKNLVHDYTMFKVSTIDSFFQKVLRAFAVEMGKRGAYETVLEDSSAIEPAVDAMYTKLGENKDLLDAMRVIANSKIEANENWNWRKDVLEAGNAVVNKDYIKLWRKSASSGKTLKAFKEELLGKMAELEEIFVKPVIILDNEILSGFASSGLGKEVFKNQSNSDLYKFLTGKVQYLDKDRNKILSGYPVVLDSWPDGDFYKISSAKATVEDLVGDRVDNIKKLFDKYYESYVSLNLAGAHLKENSILDFISEELEDYLKKEQLTLLSDAPQILSDLISGSDAPFIYEKIGTALNHYMLDEFQDTSDSQWKNFLPLLNDGISRDKESFLVGDVKQSIYRFRDGDWHLFKEDVKKQFPYHYDKDDLKINYRSLSNIVDFNNFLFSPKKTEDGGTSPGIMVNAFVRCLKDSFMSDGRNAKLEEKLCKDVIDIYNSPKQEVRDIYSGIEEKGIVDVICLNRAANQQKNSVISNKDFILLDMVRKIISLTKGVNPKYCLGDIAVLTNDNDDAAFTADYLIKHKISIISGESLLIESSKSVCLIVEALRKLSDPSSKGLEAFARISSSELKNLNLLDATSPEGEKFRNKILSGNTLYEICTIIIKKIIPPIAKGEIFFVNAFLDRVLDYSAGNGTDISSFLKWWAEKSSKLCIPEPTSGQAVRIMTMHKAKGLDFKVVFIPFLRNRMIRLPKNKWLSSDSDILGYTGPLLIDMTGDNVVNSIYSRSLIQEKMECCVDALNLAYVSFTRPKERLYIYAQDPAKDKAHTVSAALSYICSQSSMFSLKRFSIGYDEVKKYNPYTVKDDTKKDFEYIEYVLGNEDEKPYSSEKADEYNLFTTASKDASHLVPGSGSNKLKNQLKVVYDGDDNIRRGVLYHQLFSMIEAVGEDGVSRVVADAVDKFLQKNPDTLLGRDRTKLIDFVVSKLNHILEKGWFSDVFDVVSERAIISGSDFYRPDRVMIPKTGSGPVIVLDYKFGKVRDEKYHEQVRNYMNLLQEMGYSNVKGFLWYVLEDEVVPV